MSASCWCGRSIFRDRTTSSSCARWPRIKEPRLIDAWPRETKLDRRRFELLKRAYVEARYSANYEIGREDLEALTASVQRLRDLVEEVSRERLEELRQASQAGASI